MKRHRNSILLFSFSYIFESVRDTSLNNNTPLYETTVPVQFIYSFSSGTSL